MLAFPPWQPSTRASAFDRSTWRGRRDGADGARSRARLFRRSRGRPRGWRLPDAMDHELLCAGVCVFRRDLHFPAWGTPQGSRRPLPLAGRPRAWLVLLELTFLRLAWTFNVDFADYMFAGVIWMLGWCMMLMAALVQLPLTANAIFGLAIIAGHNVAALAIGGSRQSLLQGNFGWLWRIVYFGGGIATRDSRQTELLGAIQHRSVDRRHGGGLRLRCRHAHCPERRRRTCYAIGGVAIAAFFMISASASIGIQLRYRMPKCPSGCLPDGNEVSRVASLPADDAWPIDRGASLARTGQGRIAQSLAVFGRVPLFSTCCIFR